MTFRASGLEWKDAKQDGEQPERENTGCQIENYFNYKVHQLS